MARSRLLKPAFFKNETLADMGAHAQLLFAGLWTLADKRGRLEDRPRRIKAEVFPFYDAEVDAILARLEEARFIVRYQIEGNNYIQISNFEKHQHPHAKETESAIPAPTGESTGNSGASTGKAGARTPLTLNPCTLSLDPLESVHASASTGNSGTGVHAASQPAPTPRKKFIKPTLEEIAAYCKERGNSIDPETFFNHYESNGWKVGRNPMKSWKSSVIYWEKTEKDRRGRGRGSGGRPITVDDYNQRLQQKLQEYRNGNGTSADAIDGTAKRLDP